MRGRQYVHMKKLGQQATKYVENIYTTLALLQQTDTMQ